MYYCTLVQLERGKNPVLYYTGVGSRNTPPGVLATMQKLGKRLAELGYTLRSGSAQGADQAFETGCDLVLDSNKQIFLPWPSFESSFRAIHGHTNFDRPLREAHRIAASVHPAWSQMEQGPKALHARNVHQVLGPLLDEETKSSFVICWTPNGAIKASECDVSTGGTGTAIRIAERYNVPVINLKHKLALTMLKDLVLGEKHGLPSNV